MIIDGKWIWIDKNPNCDNRRVCFYDDFYITDKDLECELYICVT